MVLKTPLTTPVLQKDDNTAGRWEYSGVLQEGLKILHTSQAVL